MEGFVWRENCRIIPILSCRVLYKNTWMGSIRLSNSFYYHHPLFFYYFCLGVAWNGRLEHGRLNERTWPGQDGSIPFDSTTLFFLLSLAARLSWLDPARSKYFYWLLLNTPHVLVIKTPLITSQHPPLVLLLRRWCVWERVWRCESHPTLKCYVK